MAKAIMTDQNRAVPFGATADVQFVRGAGFDAPPLLINPAASRRDLFALAVARLARLQNSLELLSVGHFDVEPNLAEICADLQAPVDEVLCLLNEINDRDGTRDSAAA
jgi:hypothetical protein